jgi:GNAT superfamily N-acetyltransferase
LQRKELAMVAGRARVTDPTFEPIHTLADGTRVRLDLIGPRDRNDLVAGFTGLSRRSRYLRFFSAMPNLPGPLLDSLLNTDADHHVAIGARLLDADGRAAAPIIGVARYFRVDDGAPHTVEPAVAVVDSLHGRGLGRLLLKAMTRHARSRGITKMRAHALADNARIRQILAASRAVLVERDGPVMVYDVDIRSRKRRDSLVELGMMYRETNGAASPKIGDR